MRDFVVSPWIKNRIQIWENNISETSCKRNVGSAWGLWINSLGWSCQCRFVTYNHVSHNSNSRGSWRWEGQWLLRVRLKLEPATRLLLTEIFFTIWKFWGWPSYLWEAPIGQCLKTRKPETHYMWTFSECICSTLLLVVNRISVLCTVRSGTVLHL